MLVVIAIFDVRAWGKVALELRPCQSARLEDGDERTNALLHKRNVSNLHTHSVPVEQRNPGTKPRQRVVTHRIFFDCKQGRDSL